MSGTSRAGRGPSAELLVVPVVVLLLCVYLPSSTSMYGSIRTFSTRFGRRAGPLGVVGDGAFLRGRI